MFLFAALIYFHSQYFLYFFIYLYKIIFSIFYKLIIFKKEKIMKYWKNIFLLLRFVLLGFISTMLIISCNQDNKQELSQKKVIDSLTKIIDSTSKSSLYQNSLMEKNIAMLPAENVRILSTAANLYLYYNNTETPILSNKPGESPDNKKSPSLWTISFFEGNWDDATVAIHNYNGDVTSSNGWYYLGIENGTDVRVKNYTGILPPNYRWHIKRFRNSYYNIISSTGTNKLTLTYANGGFLVTEEKIVDGLPESTQAFEIQKSAK